MLPFKAGNIDHKDRNGLNNQKYNLRICSRGDNASNVSPKKNKLSKYLGVTWDKKRNKWLSQLSKGSKKNRRNLHYKLFDNEIDAAKSYNEAAIKYHGEFANLNVIG